MSMGKIIAGGAILTTAGIAFIVAGAVIGLPEIKEIKNNVVDTEEQTVTLDSNDYVFDLSAAQVTIHKTDAEKTYINYKVSNYCTVQSDTNSFKMNQKKNSWLFFWTNTFNVVDIYISEDELNSINMTLNAGEVKILDELNVKSFSLEQNAGDIEINKLNSNKASIVLNAGNIDIKDSKIKSLEFELNAGNLDATLNYKESYYTIDIEKNLGSVDLHPNDTKHQTGSEDGYKITGEVNVGNATIKFNE